MDMDFRQTQHHLNSMIKLLRCVKCSGLPKTKIFIIYQCDHKYCEKCLVKREETCNICRAARKTQPLTHDLFSTDVLSGVKKLQDSLNSSNEKTAIVANCGDEDLEAGSADVENMEVDCISNCETSELAKQNVSEILDTQVRKSLPPVKPKKIFAKIDADKTTANGDLVKDIDDNSEENNDFLNEILYPNKPRKPFQPLKTYSKSKNSKPQRISRSNYIDEPDSEEELFTASPSDPSISKGNHNVNEHPPDLTPYGHKTNTHATELRKKVKVITFETGAIKDVSVPSSIEYPIVNDDLRDVGSIEEEHSPPMLTPHAVQLEIKKDSKLGNKRSITLKRKNTSETIKESTLESKTKSGPRSHSSLSNPSIGGLNKETPFTTPIQTASRKRRTSTASLESTASSTVSILTPGIGKRNAKGETQLHVAARKGEVGKVKELIAAGLELDACDYNGYTALHEAINSRSKTKNNFIIAKVLCEAGCNVNTPAGDFKETALHEASRIGAVNIVSLLLSHKASPNIRNSHGCLARDVTSFDKVKKIIDDAASSNKGIVPHSQALDDPAVLKIQFEKALIFFAFDVSSDVINNVQNVLKLKISPELKGDVTHIIFSSENCSSEEARAPFGYDYLYGIMNGSWMLTSKWIDDSLSTGSFINPKDYEIIGCETSAVPGCTFLEGDAVPSKARINKEIGNPGLFHGMNFLLYKRTNFDKLSKKDLINLIKAGNGCVINREPNPDAVDPMENPVRFHAQDPSSKLILTSHVILFDQLNEPAKKFNMEHVKSLTVNWMMESIGNFKLMNPDDHLNF